MPSFSTFPGMPFLCFLLLHAAAACYQVTIIATVLFSLGKRPADIVDCSTLTWQAQNSGRERKSTLLQY